LHRGYVLTSGLYFATELRLSAAQLVALGTVVGLTLLTADVPGGVVGRGGVGTRSSGLVFRRGVLLARGNPEILRMLAATMLLKGGGRGDLAVPAPARRRRIPRRCLVGGLGLALLARTAGSPATLLTAAVLVAATALLVRRPS
jgi:hypothetical protein